MEEVPQPAQPGGSGQRRRRPSRRRRRHPPLASDHHLQLVLSDLGPTDHRHSVGVSRLRVLDGRRRSTQDGDDGRQLDVLLSAVHAREDVLLAASDPAGQDDHAAGDGSVRSRRSVDGLHRELDHQHVLAQLRQRSRRHGLGGREARLGDPKRFRQPGEVADRGSEPDGQGRGQPHLDCQEVHRGSTEEALLAGS